MATYKVAVVDEQKRPIAGIVVEAVSLTNWPDVTATAETGRNGAVQFTGISGPHWFRPRIQRTSATVGGRVYTGAVEVQIVGTSVGSPCYDAIVAQDGSGSHTTIAAAVEAGIGSAYWRIWICPGTYDESIYVSANSITNLSFETSHWGWIPRGYLETNVPKPGVIWRPGTSGEPCYEEENILSTNSVSFKGIDFQNPLTQNEHLVVTAALVSFEECTFRQFDSSFQVWARPTNGDFNFSFQVNKCVVSGGQFMRLAIGNLVLKDNYFSVGLDFRTGGILTNAVVHDNLWSVNSSEPAFGCTATNDISVQNNRIVQLGAGYGLEIGTTGQATRRVIISGNTVNGGVTKNGVGIFHAWNNQTGSVNSGFVISDNLVMGFDVGIYVRGIADSLDGGIVAINTLTRCNTGVKADGTLNGIVFGPNAFYDVTTADYDLPGGTGVISGDHSDLSNVTSDQHHTQNHNILSADHPDTLAASVVRGDVLVANDTPVLARLPIGAADRYLKSDGTDAAWGQVGHDELTLIGSATHAQLDSHLDAYNGSILEPITFVVTSNGTTITGTLDANPTGDMTQRFSDGYSTLSSGATVTLTVGTATAPKKRFIYILQSAKTTLVDADQWPAAEHCQIAEVIVRTAALVQTEGVLANRNWNNMAKGTDGQGHHLHTWERLRWEHSAYFSGSAVTWSGSGTAALDLAITAGKAYQMHLQGVAAFDTTTPASVLVPNHPTAAYTATADIETLVLDSAGGSLSNRYYNLVLWCSVSSGSEQERIFINLPGGSYLSESAATGDIDGFDNFSIPADFRGYAYLIQRVTIKHSPAGGGTWTIDNANIVNLRGTVPSIAVGGGTSVNQVEFADSQFRILGSVDPTKELAFEVDGISASTTRVITMPDADITLLNDTGAFPTGWSDTSITGAELETLSNGSDADVLHTHAGANLSDDIFALHAGDIYTGVHDFGGADSFELPNADAPTVNATGEIALDTLITNHTPLLRYYSGTEEMLVIAIPSNQLTSTDGHVIAYNATDDEFEMVAIPGASHNILDGSVHSDSVADGVTAGSIIIGNDTPKWDELVISIPAATIRNTLSIENGETTPTWKSDSIYPLLAGRSGDNINLVQAYLQLEGMATPAAPDAGEIKVFARITGSSIELIGQGMTGEECIICSVANVAAPANALTLNWIE